MMERRVIESEIELRARGEKPRMIVGYASVFDQLSQVMWDFREKMAPGTFASSIENGDDVRALWNHDASFVLGRTKAGTLSLAEDERGLRVEITPPDSPLVQSFLASIERGDVSQMSIGFSVLDEEWDKDEQGQFIRTVRKVKLYDVSPVTFPAYTGTEVALRAMLGDRPEPQLLNARAQRETEGARSGNGKEEQDEGESNGRAPDEIEREAVLRAQAAERERMQMKVQIVEVGNGRY